MKERRAVASSAAAMHHLPPPPRQPRLVRLSCSRAPSEPAQILIQVFVEKEFVQGGIRPTDTLQLCIRTRHQRRSSRGAWGLRLRDEATFTRLPLAETGPVSHHHKPTLWGGGTSITVVRRQFTRAPLAEDSSRGELISAFAHDGCWTVRAVAPEQSDPSAVGGEATTASSSAGFTSLLLPRFHGKDQSGLGRHPAGLNHRSR